MSIGARVRKVRLKRQETQLDVSRKTGMAVSYLSRLENGRINPSVLTLNKLGKALRVPVMSFFDAEPVLEQSDTCPVSLSGECILDQIMVTRGRPPRGLPETYTSEQLKTLRICNYLLHCRDRSIRKALSTILRSLAEMVEKNEGKPRPVFSKRRHN